MTRLVMMLLAVGLVAGCARGPRDPFAATAPDAPAWPPPPAAPRVVYAAAITRHQDLFDEGGFWNSLANIVGGPRDSAMVRPSMVAVHPEGGLLVADPGRACVHFYDWAHRRYTAVGEDLEGGLPSPMGVAVARDGSILVADSRRARVERFSARGRYLGPFAAATALQRPAGIAVDPARGDVYVVDVLADAVLVFDAEGTWRRTLGTKGSQAGAFNFPSHLALDAAGNLLVADSMNFRIQRLAPDGTPIAAFGRAGDARGDFAHPKGVAALAPDTFVAVEGLYDALVFFDGEGRLLMSLGGPGSGPGEFWLPAGVAYDAERHLLFVADSYNSRVQAFHVRLDQASVAAPPGETQR